LARFFEDGDFGNEELKENEDNIEKLLNDFEEARLLKHNTKEHAKRLADQPHSIVAMVIKFLTIILLYIFVLHFMLI
jgi:hypothetical protein